MAQFVHHGIQTRCSIAAADCTTATRPNLASHGTQFRDPMVDAKDSVGGTTKKRLQWRTIGLLDGGCGLHHDETTTKPGANGKQPGPPPPCGGTPNVIPLQQLPFLTCVVGSMPGHHICLLAPVVAPPRLPSACCLAARGLEKTAWRMVVAAKVHSGIESCLRGACTLAIGNGVAYCSGRC